MIFSEPPRHRLYAFEFSAGDPQHIAQLLKMGIQIQTMNDGRKKIDNLCFFLFIYFNLGIQLIHNTADAASHEDADNGVLFIQEMIDLTKNNGITASLTDAKHNLPLTVIPLAIPPSKKLASFTVGAAQFGKQLFGQSGVCKSYFK